MALEPLGTMKPERYAELAKDQRKLMRHNVDMPEIDYENPYIHQDFPRFLFRSQRLDGGKVRLQSSLVTNEDDQKAMLLAGWVYAPEMCDPPVETAPGAPKIPITDISVTDYVEPAPTPEPVNALQEATDAAARAKTRR